MSALVASYNHISLPILKKGQFSFVCLVLAVLVYAVLGSPTPDQPGISELIIGGLLVLSVGVSGAWQSVMSDFAGKPLWRQAGAVLLLYGLSVPLFLGLIHGHGEVAMLRDLLPFLFFLLPVFLFQRMQDWQEKTPYLLFAIIILGLAFAVRAIGGNIAGIFSKPQELFYFANAPTVLLTALVLVSWSGSKLLQAGRIGNMLKAASGIVLLALPLLAMALNVQRATLGAVFLYIMLLLIGTFVKRPARMVLPLMALGLVGWMAWPFVSEVAMVLTQKTAAVGVNMRAQEAMAVWQATAQNPMSFLFGLGWGAQFHSPAVGGLSVGFTHSLVTYSFLKMGLAGLILTGLYLAGFADSLYRLFSYRPALAVALAAPFLIDIFLYGSFKSLDFGLLLLLISAYLFQSRGAARA